MRLMDSVFPSSSMLEECLEREVVECGGIENLDKAKVPEELRKLYMPKD